MKQDNSDQARLNELRDKISKAFADVPAPKPPLIHHDCTDCLELQADFLGTIWKEVTPELLDKHFSDLSLFSAEAFHAYIPAYLKHSVENFDADMVSEFTAYAILPDKLVNEDKGHWLWWEVKLKLFSDEQFQVMLDYLDFIRDSDVSFDRVLLDRGKKRLIGLRKSSINSDISPVENRS